MRVDTLTQAIERASLATTGVTFWSDPGRSDFYRYETLLNNARAVADSLVRRGLKRQDTVAIVLGTGPDFYAAFFGACLAGGIPTALYPPARLGKVEEWKHRTAKMLAAVECAAVLTDRRLMALLGTPVRMANPKLGCHTVSQLQKQGETAYTSTTPPADIAAIQFSSGSTGDPKPVALSHENILYNARAILDALPVGADERSGVSWLPLYHDMGLVGCMISAIVSSSPMTLIGPERFVTKPVRWLQALSESRATISVAPNFAFGLTANKARDGDLQGLDLSNWKVALCGAEPVHPRTLEDFSNRFSSIGFDETAITPVYGLAEATLAVTFSDPGKTPQWTHFDADRLEQAGIAETTSNGRQIPSLGKPLSGCSIEIRNSDGVQLGETQVGRVHVKSPGVMQGYLNRPAATSDTLDEFGWLDTGDTGFIMNGELYLCGREKDIVIINGRNHDPALVEQSLDGLDGIRPGCVAAFGVDDADSGSERLVLLAEKSRELTDEDIVVNEAISAVQAGVGLSVSEFELLEPGTLPRTSSGKIRRSEARRCWLNGTLSAGKKVTRGLVLKEMGSGLVQHLRHRASHIRLVQRTR
ncbi:MAG: AMP-dependent synthetase [Myxococcales bacterium]|nr:AMP-dependent synthetase [Myxococcales bacterium]